MMASIPECGGVSMSNRKEQLERTGSLRVDRPSGNILVPDNTPRSEITMEIVLGDCMIEGVQHKRLYVCISSDGSIAECKDDEPVTAFRDDEHAIRWVQQMIIYLNRHLPERLRTMTSLTVVEAIAKSSEAHGIAKTDWKELAERHARIVEHKLKESLRVHSGPTRFFKTKQQYLDFLAEAARASRTAGKRFTQGWVAELANKKFDTEGVDERTVRQWNKDFQVNWEYWSAKVNRRN
jgi:hypothetical protein